MIYFWDLEQFCPVGRCNRFRADKIYIYMGSIYTELGWVSVIRGLSGISIAVVSNLIDFGSTKVVGDVRRIRNQ